MGCLFSKHPSLSEIPSSSFPLPILPSSSSYIPLLYKHPFLLSTIIPSLSHFITCHTNTSPSVHYDLLNPIGTGASSHITKLLHKSTQLPYALKSISFTPSQRLGLNDILNEISITSSLTHPNIMKVYEYYHNETSIDVVCEFLSGGDLFELIQKQSDKRFDEKITAEIMKQLFSAIKHCHDNAIVYRDMKLENVMVERMDEYKVKVIDFGTARRLKENEMCTQKIGSPHYVAPEIIKGEEYDYKCDLWSLGVIMYTLLYGMKPFKGSNEDELYSNIIEGKVNYTENGITLSPECKQLLENLLQVNQHHRIDINTALSSEWISLHSNTHSNINTFLSTHNDMITSIKQNIETIHIQNKLQLAFLIYVINTSPIPYKEHLSQLFTYFDINKDGLLSIDELISGLSLINANIPQSALSMFTDPNNPYPSITEDHFLIICTNRVSLISSKSLQSSFMVLDKHKNGKLSYETISSFFKANNSTITNTIWNELNVGSKEDDITYAKYSQIIKGIK